MKAKKTGILYGIGLGPGDPELITLKAIKILKSVDTIFYVAGANSEKSLSYKIATYFIKNRKKLKKLTFGMSNDRKKCENYINKNAKIITSFLQDGKDCAFVTIGDPLTYSTFIYIMESLKKNTPSLEINIVPGVTSFNAAAAKAKVPLAKGIETFAVMPNHTFNEAHRNFQPDTIVCLKPYRNLGAIIEKFKRDGTYKHFLYAANIGLNNEFITDKLETLKNIDEEYLSLLIITRS